MSNTVLEVNHLKTYYTMKKGVFGKSAGLVKAVDDVSFTIEKGKTFGLVGESGCGKTTIGKTILRLTEPTAGEAKLFGRDLFLLDQKRVKEDAHKDPDDFPGSIFLAGSQDECI